MTSEMRCDNCGADITLWHQHVCVSARRGSPKRPECWHVIEEARLMELLRRAQEGESPDLIYIEEYVNAEREEFE